MSALSRLEDGNSPRQIATTTPSMGNRQLDGPAVLALFEEGAPISTVASHAAAISQALDHRLALIRVREFTANASPADPIAWQTQQLGYRSEVNSAMQTNGAPIDGDFWLDIDRTPDAVRSVAKRVHASIVVTPRPAYEPGLDATALDLLEHTDYSLLVIPEGTRGTTGRYSRILLPVDGSSRADSVLPLARRLAASNGAAVTIAHVLPNNTVQRSGESGRANMDAGQIQEARRRAGRHLESLKHQFLASGIPVETIICGPGDPRPGLLQLIQERDFDLVVMSAHGVSALPHTPCGSVARHLLGLSNIPVLLVRSGSDFAHVRRERPQEQAIFRFGDD